MVKRRIFLFIVMLTVGLCSEGYAASDELAFEERMALLDEVNIYKSDNDTKVTIRRY